MSDYFVVQVTGKGFSDAAALCISRGTFPAAYFEPMDRSDLTPVYQVHQAYCGSNIAYCEIFIAGHSVEAQPGAKSLAPDNYTPGGGIQDSCVRISTWSTEIGNNARNHSEMYLKGCGDDKALICSKPLPARSVSGQTGSLALLNPANKECMTLPDGQYVQFEVSKMAAHFDNDIRVVVKSNLDCDSELYAVYSSVDQDVQKCHVLSESYACIFRCPCKSVACSFYIQTGVPLSLCSAFAIE